MLNARIMNKKDLSIAFPPCSYPVDSCRGRGLDSEELLSAVLGFNPPGNYIAVFLGDGLAYLASVIKQITGGEGRCNRKHTYSEKKLSFHRFLL
jgi:hypothetical protein